MNSKIISFDLLRSLMVSSWTVKLFHVRLEYKNNKMLSFEKIGALSDWRMLIKQSFIFNSSKSVLCIESVKFWRKLIKNYSYITLEKFITKCELLVLFPGVAHSETLIQVEMKNYLITRIPGCPAKIQQFRKLEAQPSSILC